ncbi:MAG: hypothetical protein LBK60_06690 [Verrucomicrobiales bacterium]|nr:hypothetical protein [Verrucomicrobiales bacterium]
MSKKLLVAGVALILLFPLPPAAVWFWGKSLPKTYRSYTTVQVDKETREANPFFLQTEFEVIKSQTILLPVIQKLGLAEKIKQRLKASGLTDAQIYQLFLHQYLNVRQFHNTKLIEIAVEAPAAAEAAQIANAVAERYAEYRATMLQQAANQAAAPFIEQVAKQEKVVAEQEARVAAADGDKPAELEQAGRELEAQRQILKLLKTRCQQELVDLKVKIEPVTIINKAEPNPRPVKPKMPLIMLAGCVAGLPLLLTGGVLVIIALVVGKTR